MSILNDIPSRSYHHFQMSKNLFQVIYQEVVSKGIVKTEELINEEQVSMFLHILSYAYWRRATDNYKKCIVGKIKCEIEEVIELNT